MPALAKASSSSSLAAVATRVSARTYQPPDRIRLRAHSMKRLSASAGPDIVAVAGPNGAGKSTVGARLLEETLGIRQFVNADDIARGLSAFAPESAAFEAGRVMLRWMGDLARRRETFAFETTLSGRGHARLIGELVATGYTFHLIYLWLESPELALQRVADRVRRGGHAVADAVVRRRYHRGLRNFRELYRALATTWKVYDNSAPSPARPIAMGSGTEAVEILDVYTWQRIEGSSTR